MGDARLEAARVAGEGFEQRCAAAEREQRRDGRTGCRLTAETMLIEASGRLTRERAAEAWQYWLSSCEICRW